MATALGWTAVVMVYIVAVTVVVGVLPERHLLSPKWVRPMCTATVTYEYARAVKALCRRIDLE